MVNNLQHILKNVTNEDIKILRKLFHALEIDPNKPTSDSKSLRDYSEEYYKYIEFSFSKKYLSSIKLSFNHLIYFFSDETKLENLSVKDVENFKHYLMNKAPKGYKVYLRNLKASFNCAINWDYTTSNPFTKIRLKRKQESKPTYISKQSFKDILEVTRNPIFANLFLLCYMTGIRLGEATNLRWSNFDFKKNFLLIGGAHFRTKNSKDRIIPLSNEIQNVFKPIYKNGERKDNFVFEKDSGYKYTEEYVSRYFKKCCRVANIDPIITFHALRHSFCTNLLEQGAPIHTVKDLAGHSSIAVTEIYLHTNLESMENSISKLNNFLSLD